MLFGNNFLFDCQYIIKKESYNSSVWIK